MPNRDNRLFGVTTSSTTTIHLCTLSKVRLVTSMCPAQAESVFLLGLLILHSNVRLQVRAR